MPEVQISAREWRWVAIFALSVMALTCVPYLVGAAAAGHGWTFSGFVFGAEDGYSYLAKMRLGARGEWLFTIRYTDEPHSAAFFFAPYLLLGKIAALFAEPSSPRLFAALIVTFHAARVAAGALLLGVIYRFAAHFLRDVRARRTALALIALGGGLGWLLTLLGRSEWLGSLPLDFYVPEAYTFLILYGLPHLALARVALLLGLLLMLGALGAERWLKRALGAGVAWAVMGLCVPFYVAVLYVLLGAWGLVSWARWRRFPRRLAQRAGVAALVPLPYLGYTAWMFWHDEVLAGWSAQNLLPAPHPLHYAAGYGVWLVFALIAVPRFWRAGGEGHLLLVAWLALLPIVYLPLNVQRRLGEGVIVALGVLAVAGAAGGNVAPAGDGGRAARGEQSSPPTRGKAARGAPKGARRRAPSRRAFAVLLALTLPTSALLLFGGALSAARPQRPLFWPTAELRALDALNALAPPDAVVLSLKPSGAVIPARSDLIAYIGHGPETLYSAQKAAQAERFFADTLPADERRAVLARVDYIFYGELERALSPDPSAPPWAEGMRVVVRSPAVTVYEVRHAD